MLNKGVGLSVSVMVALSASAAAAQSLKAHEHGKSALNIAIEGEALAMELIAPGADIVGFEHEASSKEDIAAVEAAKKTLADAAALFVTSKAAQCVVAEVEVELEEEEHEEHHDDHHDHDEHKEHDHHAEEHDEHKHHDDHDEDHADHHDAHEDEEGANHNEFHAQYAFTCANPSELKEISTTFFKSFPRAEEIHATVVSTKGQSVFELEPGAPTLNLE